MCIIIRQKYDGRGREQKLYTWVWRLPQNALVTIKEAQEDQEEEVDIKRQPSGRLIATITILISNAWHEKLTFLLSLPLVLKSGAILW